MKIPFISSYAKLFTSPTVDEIAAQKAKEAAIVIAQTEHTIRSQQFLKHMAEHELIAINKWVSRQEFFQDKDA